MFVYVGAYTEPPLGSADGIAVFRFDSGTGALDPVQTVPGVVNPSWLTLDGPEQILFAANEEGEGRVSSFARAYSPRASGTTDRAPGSPQA